MSNFIRVSCLTAVSLALAACGASSGADDPAAVSDTPNAMRPDGVANDDPFVRAQEGDLAPCPGINPDIRRPAGSNCLGITPDTCGAEEAKRFVGMVADLRTREKVGQSATGAIRWISPETAQNDDLVPSRLNVMLDVDNVIIEVDCY